MRRTRCYILLMLCLLLPAIAIAQAGDKTLFELQRGADGNYRLHFRTGKISFSQDQDNQLTLSVDGMANMAPGKGQPALPQTSRLLILPRGAELRVERWQQSESEILSLPDGKVLAPWQGAMVKDAEPMTVLPDKEVYSTDSFMRWSDPMEIENLGVMGNRQIFRITMHPVAYNPVTHELSVTQVLSATLITTSPTLPAFESQFPKRYLIVSRQQFREGLQPFVRWKQQEGYRVEEIYADTNRRDSVKALIYEAFGDGLTTPWPCYILIVGDAAQIQAYTGTTRPAGLGTHPTDLYYADHTGDNMPDAILGRWPVSDTAELRAVVEKTLRYERGIDLDTAALHRALLVAGKESQDPAPITTNGQVNYLKREIKRTDASIDTLCHYNPASVSQGRQILSEIRNGVGLLNYTAHCTTSGWSNPPVTFNSIDTLSMHRPTVFINNCCQSNNFTGTCFGEQLLRKPHSGGVAVIGATNSTLWNEDFYWAVGPKYPFSLDPQYDSLRPGAFDPWLGGETNTIGQILVAGNLAVTAFGSPHSRFYWEIYCLFGDPALVPWFGTPQMVQLTVSDTVAVGTMELQVSGTPYATVSAMQGDDQLGVATIGQNGSVLLHFSRPTDNAPILFTATKPRMLPVELTTLSAMPQGKAVAFTDAELANSAARFTLVNLGTDTLFGVSVTVTAADSGAMYASFTAATATYDTLPPQASHTLHMPLHIDRWAPLLDAQISAADASGDSWHLRMSTNLDGTLPELSFTLADSDTMPTAALLCGASYLIGVSTIGICDTLHASVSTLPDGTTTEGAEGWLPVTIGANATHLRLTGHIAHGNYNRNYEYYLNVGGCRDGFGNGLQAYPWQTGGTLPWTVDSAVSHTGSYSLRSGAIDYRQTSSLTLDVLLPSNDSISFWLRTSTEQDYDKLTFTIDGIKRFDASGSFNWRRYAFLISAGAHTLCWRYTKDESTSSGSDCVWLDDVRLPLSLWDTPCGANANDGMLGIIEQCHTSSQLLLFPNPSDGNIKIESTSGNPNSIRINDLYGRVVYAADLGRAAMPASLTLPLPDGIYFVELHTDLGTAHSKLIIIHP